MCWGSVHGVSMREQEQRLTRGAESREKHRNMEIQGDFPAQAPAPGVSCSLQPLRASTAQRHLARHPRTSGAVWLRWLRSARRERKGQHHWPKRGSVAGSRAAVAFCQHKEISSKGPRHHETVTNA